MKTVAIYPGSFDPCTNGHLDIIARAAGIFDTLIVAVLVNNSKKPAFSVAEREALLRRVTAHLPNVEVDAFSGLLVDYAQKRGANVIVKGLRAVSDFEYEFQMALANRKLDSEAETIFMTTTAENMYLSSSIVREIASLGGSIQGMVPECIIKDIETKLLHKEDENNGNA